MSFHKAAAPSQETHPDKGHKKHTSDHPVSVEAPAKTRPVDIYGPDGRNCYGETREQTMARRERDRIDSERFGGAFV